LVPIFFLSVSSQNGRTSLTHCKYVHHNSRTFR